MKPILKLLVVIVFIIGSGGCAKNEKIREGIYRGMYDGMNQSREMEHVDEDRQPGSETPSYDQYKREREEALSDDKENK